VRFVFVFTSTISFLILLSVWLYHFYRRKYLTVVERYFSLFCFTGLLWVLSNLFTAFVKTVFMMQMTYFTGLWSSYFAFVWSVAYTNTWRVRILGLEILTRRFRNIGFFVNVFLSLLCFYPSAIVRYATTIDMGRFEGAVGLGFYPWAVVCGSYLVSCVYSYIRGYREAVLPQVKERYVRLLKIVFFCVGFIILGSILLPAFGVLYLANIDTLVFSVSMWLVLYMVLLSETDYLKLFFYKLLVSVAVTLTSIAIFLFVYRKLLGLMSAAGALLFSSVCSVVSNFIFYRLLMDLLETFRVDVYKDVTETLIREVREKIERVKEKHKLDPLTGFFRKVDFFKEVKKYIEINKKLGLPAAMIVIDLDNFKELNDKYGHQFGDKVLKIVAKRIKSVCRENDLISRFGGDEFAIFPVAQRRDSGEISVSTLRHFVKRLRGNIEQKISINDNTSDNSSADVIIPRVSIGYSVSSWYDYKELFEEADKMMYEDKNRRKNKMNKADDLLKLVMIILLPFSALSLSFCQELLQLLEGRIFNTADVPVYNLEVKTSSSKQFYSVLSPGESIYAPADNFLVTYTYFSEADNRYVKATQSFKGQKFKQAVTSATLEEEVDSSRSYWYDDNTYILILTSKQPLTYTVLPAISQAVEGEDEEQPSERSSKVKYVYLVSDLVCLGQTTKFKTKRAVFILRPITRKDIYTILCRVERKGVYRILRFNIPRRKL
jgi:diguanylate cyclase (GGDEF)-like protein